MNGGMSRRMDGWVEGWIAGAREKHSLLNGQLGKYLWREV